MSGPPGSGKSAVVETALRSEKVRAAAPVVVRLSGTMHNEELAAYRSIARQLGACAEDGDAPGARQAEAAAGREDGSGDGGEWAPRTTVECLALVRQRLARPTAAGAMAPAAVLAEGVARGVVFVLDEFDKFATGAAPKQTLLYNLLNMLHEPASGAVPGVVIGMSVRVDALELLEKRVRSRFSQRVLHVPMATSAEEIMHHIALRMAPARPAPKCRRGADGGANAGSGDGAQLEALYRGDAKVRALADRQFARNRAVRPFLRAVRHAVGHRRAHSASPMVTASALCDGFAFVSGGASRHRMLESLSILELSLLVGLRLLKFVKRRRAPCFDEVYVEYRTLVNSVGGVAGTADVDDVLAGSVVTSSDVFSKRVAFRAFERLIDAELLAYGGGGGGGSSSSASASLVASVPKEKRAVELRLYPDEIDAALRAHPMASTVLQRWGASWTE